MFVHQNVKHILTYKFTTTSPFISDLKNIELIGMCRQKKKIKIPILGF